MGRLSAWWWSTAVVAVLGFSAALLPPMPLLVRVVMMVASALVAPGYALAAVLWPMGTLTSAERAVLSGAGTLALLVLVSVGLAALPIGLTLVSVSSTLSAVTLGLLIARQSHRLRRITGEVRQASARARWRVRDVVGIGIAVGVVVAALAVAHGGAEHAANLTAFSQLYIQNEPSDSRQVVVGVRSSEREPTTFRLVVEATGRRRPLLTVAAIRLSDGDEVVRTVIVPNNVKRSSVRAVLYLTGSDVPYRTVNLGG